MNLEVLENTTISSSPASEKRDLFVLGVFIIAGRVFFLDFGDLSFFCSYISEWVICVAYI